MVVEYSCGGAYRAEPIIAEYVAAETVVRFQREGLEAGNVLFYSDSDANTHHTPKLVEKR